MRYTALILLSLTLLSPREARGDEALRKAKVLFKKAELHFSLGEFKEALKLYKQAYVLKPLPGFHFNLAQCHRNLGQCRLARFHYRQYLALVPKAPNRKVVEELIAECTIKEPSWMTSKSATQPSAGGAASRPTAGAGATQATPETSNEPDGAAASNATPSAADAAGGGSAGQPNNGSAVAQRTTEPGPPPAAAASPGQRPDRDRSDASSTRSVLLWTGVGVTAALLAGAGITGGLGLAKSSEFKDPTTPRGQLSSLEDSGRALLTASVVMMAAGGAAGIATALIYFLYPTAAESRVAVTGVPFNGGGVLSAVGRF